MEKNNKSEKNIPDENKRKRRKPNNFSPEGFSGQKFKKMGTKDITKNNPVASTLVRVLTERNVAEATGKSCDQMPSTSGVRNSTKNKVLKKQPKTVNSHKDVSETMKSSVMSISDISDASPAVIKDRNHARVHDINILKNLNAAIDDNKKTNESINNIAGQVVHHTDSSALNRQDKQDKLNELSENESSESDEMEASSGENSAEDDELEESSSENSQEDDEKEEDDDVREDENQQPVVNSDIDPDAEINDLLIVVNAENQQQLFNNVNDYDAEINNPLNVVNIENQQQVFNNDNDYDAEINNPLNVVNIENQQQLFNNDNDYDAEMNNPPNIVNIEYQQHLFNNDNDPDADMYESLNHQIYSSDDRHVRPLRDGIYIQSNVYLSATHTVRKFTHMIRRLMDGVFKRNELRNVTLTGRSNTEILHPKAMKAIIDFTKNFKQWKKIPSRVALNRGITLKVNEMKGGNTSQP